MLIDEQLTRKNKDVNQYQKEKNELDNSINRTSREVGKAK
jgi:hypothetical protein